MQTSQSSAGTRRRYSCFEGNRLCLASGNKTQITNKERIFKKPHSVRCGAELPVFLHRGQDGAAAGPAPGPTSADRKLRGSRSPRSGAPGAAGPGGGRSLLPACSAELRPPRPFPPPLVRPVLSPARSASGRIWRGGPRFRQGKGTRRHGRPAAPAGAALAAARGRDRVRARAGGGHHRASPTEEAVAPRIPGAAAAAGAAPAAVRSGPAGGSGRRAVPWAEERGRSERSGSARHGAGCSGLRGSPAGRGNEPGLAAAPVNSGSDIQDQLSFPVLSAMRRARCGPCRSLPVLFLSLFYFPCLQLREAQLGLPCRDTGFWPPATGKFLFGSSQDCIC